MRFLLLPPRLFLTAAALCLALCAAPFPAAADPAAKPRPFPFQSVIVSVDATARTFCMGKKVFRQVHEIGRAHV